MVQDTTFIHQYRISLLTTTSVTAITATLQYQVEIFLEECHYTVTERGVDIN